jgi:hypothetical protein
LAIYAVVLRSATVNQSFDVITVRIRLECVVILQSVMS